MSRIRSLKANVTQDEAVAQFSAGILSSFRTLAFGGVRSVADTYIPFRLFQVSVSNRQRQEQQFLALDAVNGTLDLYRFDEIPSPSEVVVLETRNCPPAQLDDAHARELVVEKFRRVLFNRGFFRLGELRITATPLPGEIHVPYWVAFRGNGNRVHLEIIDAVRRRYEGAKVRKLLETWLAATQ